MKKTKKIIRLINRKKTLEALSLDGKAYCLKHNKYLCVEDVNKHHRYSGNHKTSYCKYLEMFK